MKCTLAIVLLFATYSMETCAQSGQTAVADSLYLVGNYPMAINTYAKEHRLENSLQIARAYTAMGANTKALEQYKGLLKEYGDQPVAQFEMAKLLLKLKKNSAAASLFSQLVEADPHNAELHYYLGRSYWESEKVDAANKAFRAAVEQDSTHIKSIFQLGKYYVANGQKDSVLFFVNKGLSTYPDDASLINLKGLAFFNNEQYFKAEPLFEQLLQLGETSAHIYEKLGNCQLQNRKLEEAKANYHQLVSREELLPQAYLGLGKVFWWQSQRDSARIYFKKAIEAKKPYLGEEYRNLGLLEHREGNLALSLEYYQKAAEENPLDYTNYYEVCVLADEYYKDPETKLRYFEEFEKRYPRVPAYFQHYIHKRISELKEEIHYATD